MATMTITIPDAQATRVINALCAAGDYNAETDGPKAAFAKTQVIRWIKNMVLSVESSQHERDLRLSMPPPVAIDDLS